MFKSKKEVKPVATLKGYRVYWRDWRFIMEACCANALEGTEVLQGWGRSSLVTECAVKGGMHVVLWRRKDTLLGRQVNLTNPTVCNDTIQMSSGLGSTHAMLGRWPVLPRPQGCWEYGHWLHPLDCTLGQVDLYAPLEICYFKMSSVVSGPMIRDENVKLFFY